MFKSLGVIDIGAYRSARVALVASKGTDDPVHTHSLVRKLTYHIHNGQRIKVQI